MRNLSDSATGLRRSPVTPWVGRTILAAVFLWAGIAKAMHREDFFNAVAHYGLLSPNAAYRLVLALPWVEMALAVALVFPLRRVRLAGALASLGLLVVFTGGLVSLWAQGKHVNCGCFGGSGQSHPAWSVLRNAGLIVCAVAALRGTLVTPSRHGGGR